MNHNSGEVDNCRVAAARSSNGRNLTTGVVRLSAPLATPSPWALIATLLLLLQRCLWTSLAKAWASKWVLGCASTAARMNCRVGGCMCVCMCDAQTSVLVK